MNTHERTRIKMINATAFHKGMYLDNDKLEPPDSECPFCGFGNRQPLFVLQDNPAVLLLKCTTCNAASASRIPTNNALREYYRTYYDSRINSDSSGATTCDDTVPFARHLANIILRYTSEPNVSILDFGGGDGSISYSLALQLLKGGVKGINISVIDYYDKTVLPQNSRILMNKVEALEEIGSLYSIVIASAVIEHLPKPSETLHGLLNRLQDGGIFYARTPYVVPLMEICSLIGVELDFTYPAHIHDLGQDFWETYFKNGSLVGDFQILESRPSIAETTLEKHFLRTVASLCLKAPWYLLGRRYKLVGGWEVFVRKNPGKESGIRQ